MSTMILPRTDGGKVRGVGIARGYSLEAFAMKRDIAAVLVAKGRRLRAEMEHREHDEATIMQALEGFGYGGLGLELRSLRMLQLRGLDRMHEAISENTLVNGGTAIMLDALIGTSITYYTNAVAALGVGDSNAAFNLTHTNLQGAVNVTDRIRKAMNATYPSRAANVVTWQATFGTGDANFQWNEWALFNNVTDGSGTMLNRAVNNLGTKTSATQWQLTVTLTQT